VQIYKAVAKEELNWTIGDLRNEKERDYMVKQRADVT
jgi:hypothetical protein